MKITPEVLSEHFRKMELFDALPTQILAQLAQRCKVRQFEPNAVVFRKNEPGSSLFLIVEGAVKIHDEEYEVAHLEVGSYFGELALLDEGPRSLSVTCTRVSMLAEINRKLFFEVLSTSSELVQKITGMLTQRLRIQTDNVVAQLRRREEELTRLVEERTAELYRQMEKAEAEKQEAEYQRQRAEQSERFEQQFLANMSHEIRTPMNAVLGMTNLLLRRDPRTDQIKYLKSIQNASKALLVILNDILDMSKIEAGKMDLDWTDCSLQEILEQTKRTLAFKAEEKGLDFVFQVDPAIPPVLKADPVRLQQILMNLAGNAIKFTDQGGVRIDATLVEQAGDRYRIRIEVIDTGIGMSEAELAYVFESFRQAGVVTARKYGGTGLGLSISRQLVELFGGSISVESAVDKGSVFRFDVLLGHSELTYLPPADAPMAAPDMLHGLRILLAEDNEYNRIVAVETLEWIVPEVKVVAVQNGEEALQILQEQPFDLILMDVAMPVLDGLQATRRIRNGAAPLRDIPIIAFTASVTTKEQQECLDAGMNACVAKPFREEELIDGILAALQGAEYQAAAPRPEMPAETPAFPFLRQLTGSNPDKMKKYLGLYLDSARTALGRLAAEDVLNDLNDVRRTVHALKPQLRLLDLPQTGELAENIERLILDNLDPAPLPGWLQDLRRDLADSVRNVENYLAGMASN